MTDPAALLALAHAAADHWSAQGYEEYLGSVVINSGLSPRRFRDAADPWQWDRSLEIAPALMKLAGFGVEYDGPLNFWWEYAKGCDKTTSTSREMSWLLAYSKRPLIMYACGGDKDQAALIRLAMEQELELNPWLKARVTVSGYSAVGTSGSTLEIMATDAATGQGKFPDYMVFEEVTSWKHERSRDFWAAMITATTKRPSCVVKVNTNAGWKGTWQDEVRKEILKSPIWRTRIQAERTNIASWMSPEKIAEVRKLVLPVEAKRVYDNIWIDLSEENGYISLAEAEACVDPILTERTSGNSGDRHWIVVDYGGVNDRAALGVGHNPAGTDDLLVDRLDCWQGTHDRPNQVLRLGTSPGANSVEGWIDDQYGRFPNATLVLDPHQLESLAQKYEQLGRRVIRFAYDGGKRNHQMAELLHQMVTGRRVKWSAEAGLLPGAEDDTMAKEMSMLVLKTMEYGYRFDHKSGRHDDRTTCVAMMALHAMDPQERPRKMGANTPAAVQVGPAGPVQQLQQLDHARQHNTFGVGSQLPGYGGVNSGNPFARR